MKSSFNDFYGYSKENIKELWEQCIFVFDANVLLNLYRYTEPTREQLLKIFEQLKDRIWIPHQVGLEFHFNRATVVQDQLDSYESICRSIEKKSVKIINELNDELKDYKKRHPRVNVPGVIEEIEQSFKNLITDIKALEKDHPNYFKNEDDKILHEITELFLDKIGSSYDQNRLNSIYKDGEMRYKSEIPPGYEDLKEKKGKKKFYNNVYIHSEYGDLILWNQIIDESLQKKKPVIFITDDEKEDWWSIVKNRKTIGPRVELINEFRLKTTYDFYMYKTDRFMNFAMQYLDVENNPDAIQEVKEVRESRKLDPPIEFFNYYKEMFGSEYPNLNENDWLEFESMYEREVDPDDPFDQVSTETVFKWAGIRDFERALDHNLNKEIETKYKIDDIVLHRKWGTGKIIEVRGQGQATQILVDFPKVGKKRLLAHFAPLEKIMY
ncbi:PIN-like domain-containing protein [Peribacillus alkalitolerans]|uniref:PIN-like domain-containing protein n=1 Tax=Peribacillus alkalitolerans TaxID=1550385 RepID=UPI0013D8AF8D|nr:PIN-like domain-containing protein [Peribacillus alkalitolerans]